MKVRPEVDRFAIEDVSLDGHFDGPGGNFMAMPLDHHFDTFLLGEMRNASTMLLGGRARTSGSGRLGRRCRTTRTRRPRSVRSRRCMTRSTRSSSHIADDVRAGAVLQTLLRAIRATLRSSGPGATPHAQRSHDPSSPPSSPAASTAPLSCQQDCYLIARASRFRVLQA